MGLFKALTDWFYRRGAKSRFRSYVTPELVDQILRDPALAAPVRRPLDFVLVLVRDDNMDEVPDRLSRIVDAASEAGGMVEGLRGPLVVATFGSLLLREPPNPAENARRRSELIARLQAEYGPDIKILHGACIALVGNFGSRLWFSYGSLLPKFSHMLDTLASMDFGEAKEWTHGVPVH